MEVPFASLKSSDDEVEWFRRFIAEHSKGIYKNSDFDNMLGDLENFAKYSKGKVEILPADEEFPDFLRHSVASSYLIRLLRENFNNIKDEFLGHLQHFRGTDICLMRKANSTMARNKSWELVVALVCSSFCQNVKQGKPEPDVIVTVHGLEWAMPCKVLYSEIVENQLKPIIKGIKQIENSDFDQGVVMVNISNLVRHENYFFKSPEPTKYYSYATFEDAMSDFRKEVNDIFVRLQTSNSNFTSIYYDKNGKRREKTKAVLWFAQVVTVVMGKPVLLTQPMMTPLNNGKIEEVKEILGLPNFLKGNRPIS
jgi:hypothetical protein